MVGKDSWLLGAEVLAQHQPQIKDWKIPEYKRVVIERPAATARG